MGRPKGHWGIALATLVGALGIPQPVHAAPPGPEPAPPEKKTPAAPLREGRRAVPDYDGRPSTPDDGENAGTWTLRVVFFPAYVVSEYVLRRPLGWLTVAAERANVVNVVLDFFTFGPDRKAGVFPTALLDFGFAPSVGLYFFWDDAFADDNHLRIHAATWGPEWLRLTMADFYEFEPGRHVGVRLEGWRRPDWLFHGLGPRSDQDAEGRYSRDDLAGSLHLELELPRTSWFNAYAGVRRSTFGTDACCGPRLIGRVNRGTYPLPPGFEEGFTSYRQGFTLALDSRLPRPDRASGLRLALRAEQDVRLSGSGPDQWVRYGGTAGGFVDLTGHDRTIGLSVTAAFADPVGSSTPIPFTEQVVLGGNYLMRGFLEGRLVDRSALVAKLEYTWPVWVLFDGSLSAEVGNVFGEHLSNFDPELARLSFGFGVRAHGRRDYPFEALIGMGTAPLADGADVESVRIVFGATNGF